MRPVYRIKLFLARLRSNTFTLKYSLLMRTACHLRFMTPLRVSNDHIPKLRNAMDMCVIPSLWPETGPLTVYDAWNAGIPVIGTDMAGIAERVTHGENGLLFSRSDSVGLQECILRFFNEPALLKQMMQKIRRREPESDMALAIRGLYTQILNGKGGHF